MSTNMFSTELRTFDTADKVMGFASNIRCVLDKVPGLGNLLEIPFTIMEKYRSVKT